MKKIILASTPPRFKSKNPFSFDAWLQFEPMPNYEPGVFWKLPAGNGNFKYIPIDWRIAKLSRLHNIYLQYGWNFLHVYEHISAVRGMGLDSFCISGSWWPPYVTTGTMVDHIRPYLQETTEDIPFLTFSGSYGPLKDIHRNGLESSIALDPADFGELILDTRIKYERYNIEQHDFDVMSPELLNRIFYVGPQGVLRWQAKVSKIFDLQYDKVVVFPENEPDLRVLSQKFIDHTKVDRIGEFMLFSHTHHPSCKVISDCAGHYLAMKLIKHVAIQEGFQLQIPMPTFSLST